MKDAEECKYPPKLDWAVLAIRWVVVVHFFGLVALFGYLAYKVVTGQLF